MKLHESSSQMLYADLEISQKRVQALILEYEEYSRNSSLAKFTISKMLNIEEAAQLSEGRHGVYSLYRRDETLIYIGMSLSDISKRINNHLKPGVQASAFWLTRRPVLAQTVFVTHSWEAPSLEEFLVQKVTGSLGS